MPIYPCSSGLQIPFALTSEEKRVIKQHLVTAFEKDIQTDQDRALFALKAAKFEPKRELEIHSRLWELFSLETELIGEVNKDMLVLEEAYADGAEDKAILAEAMACDAIDKEIFADRFIKVKRGELVNIPVVPVEIIAEPKELEGEIIKP